MARGYRGPRAPAAAIHLGNVSLPMLVRRGPRCGRSPASHSSGPRLESAYFREPSVFPQVLQSPKGYIVQCTRLGVAASSIQACSALLLLLNVAKEIPARVHAWRLNAAALRYSSRVMRPSLRRFARWRSRSVLRFVSARALTRAAFRKSIAPIVRSPKFSRSTRVILSSERDLTSITETG